MVDRDRRKSAAYTSRLRASMTGETSPGGEVSLSASASRLPKAVAGRPSAHASPFVVARPTRRPVKDPGPEQATNTSTSETASDATSSARSSSLSSEPP